MDSVFPFGFPWATSLYLSLYVGCLVLHVLLMNYVIAGTVVLAVGGLGRGAKAASSPSLRLLRDWMPFALGGAITAGVAPLLFIQILYRQPFYTANLLLFHRWMAILPALIVGFYLLYLFKSRWLEGRAAGLSVVVGMVALVCFGFVGYSWTENHLLANAGQDTWTEFYESGRVFYFNESLLPRLLVWFCGAFPTMWMLLAWQMRHFEYRALDGGQSGSERDDPSAGGQSSPDAGPSGETGFVVAGTAGVSYQLSLAAMAREAGGMSIAAWAAMGLAVIAAIWYLVTESAAVRSAVFGWVAGPYWILLIMGLVAQGWGWFQIYQNQTFRGSGLRWVTVGVVSTVAGATVIREVIRLVQLDLEPLFQQHSQAAQVGGLWVFLAFLVINILVISWCLRGIAKSV